jgi:hypothetical protein
VSNGKITLGSQVTLSWGSIDGKPDLATVDYVNGEIEWVLDNMPPQYIPPAYIKSTYIDAVKILSPTIAAGTFYGARYYNLKNTPSATVNPIGDAYLTMNTNGFLILHSDSYDANVFALGSGQYLPDSDVYQRGCNIWSYDRNWLGFNAEQNKTYPKGVWDFSVAEVIGINAGGSGGFTDYTTLGNYQNANSLHANLTYVTTPIGRLTLTQFVQQLIG